MPRIDLEQQLGEISRECNFHLLKQLSKLDILPWNAAPQHPGKASGVVQFLRYDPTSTSFRTLPNTRCFQGAVKVGLLDNHQAQLLSVRLLDFCRQMLPRYDGYYSAELGGKIARIVRRAADLQDMGLIEIDRDFLPDDLYAAMPWAGKPEYFAAGGVKRVPIAENLLKALKHPLMVLGVGIDAVCRGPSAGLTVSDILELLDQLQKGESKTSTVKSNSDALTRMMIPSIAGGFQGFTVANFVNLSDAVLYEVVNHLHQFGETIGQKCEQVRQQGAKEILRTYDSLEDVADAFLMIFPPVNHIIVARGKNAYGLELNREDGVWAGYSQMSKHQLAVAQGAKENDRYFAKFGGDNFRIEVKLMDDLPTLEPALTRIRMTDSMARITSSIDEASPRPAVRRNELISVLENLERQISDGVKVQASCRALYVLDAILKNYADGETRLHNAAARSFITRRLGRPAVGYQVAGKSSDRLVKEIARLIHDIQFETPTNAVLRARWRPTNAQLSSISSSSSRLGCVDKSREPDLGCSER
jgi:hypothetical protein